jgi:hypothetical protein
MSGNIEDQRTSFKVDRDTHKYAREMKREDETWNDYIRALADIRKAEQDDE